MTILAGGPDPGSAPPIMIGGTGGSGTRVLVAIQREAGLYTGCKLSAALDSRHGNKFVRRWIPPVLAAGLAGLPRSELRDLHRDLESTLPHQ